jgi:putative NADPH-quinone reductase
LEPDELQALQTTFNRLKAELHVSADNDLHILAYDLMTAYERHYPDCEQAAEAVLRAYRARE